MMECVITRWFMYGLKFINFRIMAKGDILESASSLSTLPKWTGSLVFDSTRDLPTLPPWTGTLVSYVSDIYHSPIECNATTLAHNPLNSSQFSSINPKHFQHNVRFSTSPFIHQSQNHAFFFFQIPLVFH